jgi:hypothetical protein
MIIGSLSDISGWIVLWIYPERLRGSRLDISKLIAVTLSSGCILMVLISKYIPTVYPPFY